MESWFRDKKIYCGHLEILRGKKQHKTSLKGEMNDAEREREKEEEEEEEEEKEEGATLHIHVALQRVGP